MKVHLNGKTIDVAASTLVDVVEELGYDGAIVATAVNKSFVPRTRRAGIALRDGDAIEIITPMKGG
jgi:sulfur carrier protein